MKLGFLRDHQNWRQQSFHKKGRLTVHLLRINTIKSVIGRKILPIFVASLLSIVFCGSAWATSLRFKLEMLGYNEEEIAAIVSRKKSRAEIDRKIRMEMLCLSVAKPLMPSDLQNRKAKS